MYNNQRKWVCAAWKLLWRKSFHELFHVLSVNLRVRVGFSAAGCPSCEAWQCPVLLLQGMLGPALPRCGVGESLSFFGEMGQY